MSLLFAYLMLAGALVIDNGAIWGLPLALVAFAGLVGAVRSANSDGSSSDAASPAVWRRRLAIAIALVGALGLVRAPGMYLEPATPRALFVLLTVLATALVLAGLLRPALQPRGALAILVGLYTIAGAVVIVRSPAPRIDVFQIEQAGAAALTEGRNPYQAIYPNPYDAAKTRLFYGDDRAVLDCYPYPPASLLWTSAGYWFTGDVRWTLLLAQLLIALGLWWIARRAGHPPEVALAVAALHLLHPRGLFVLEQAWTDGLPALAFVGLIAATMAEGGAARAGIALGLLLGFKQYGVLVLPLLVGRRLVSRAALALGLAVALLVTLPFFVWSPRDFIADVILCQLRQPLRLDAMSLPALVASATGLELPGALALVGAGGAIAWARRRSGAGPAALALATALTFAAFFLSAKQAFCNYYYLVGVLILTALAGTKETA